MLTTPRSLASTLLAAATLFACAESDPPTQPVARVPGPGGVTAPTADVATTAELPSTISACYVPGKGSIYRIKTADTPSVCNKKDVEFSWVDRPVRAVAGLTFHSEAITIPADGRFLSGCPAGESVINFGWEIPINSTAQASQIKAVRPRTNGGQIGWGIQATPGTAYVLYWTCAPADPLTLAP
jgi:hypothetical protein